MNLDKEMLLIIFVMLAGTFLAFSNHFLGYLLLGGIALYSYFKQKELTNKSTKKKLKKGVC